MASSNVEPFTGQLYCRDHGRLTCLVCLHSVNSISGLIPPPNLRYFACGESAHSVQPIFELFDTTPQFRGFQGGLSAQKRRECKTDHKLPQIAIEDLAHCFDCKLCGLAYATQGGPGYADIHPSHVSEDGKRYILIDVLPFKFRRKLDKLVCSVQFLSSAENSKLAKDYEVFSRPDDGTVDWNLDNLQISALVQLRHMVEHVIIPQRKKVVKGFIYTNSRYFEGQSWRFQLVVYTSISQDCLDLLLRVHKLKYSQSRQAFVERNALGLVTKKYPVTEERRRQIVYFLQMVKKLAVEYGIQILWSREEPTEEFKEARRVFLHEPSTLQRAIAQEAQRGLALNPNEARYVVDGDLLEGDSLEALPPREGFDAVVQQGEDLIIHYSHNALQPNDRYCYIGGPELPGPPSATVIYPMVYGPAPETEEG
ncbi:hypothetical protein GGR53DRAFT_467146 [Hypoxylon sp. FL1150]|nr:hypothetical protein GGR53DRAFT_467146 [Hypoxylon sp. FL1150]